MIGRAVHEDDGACFGWLRDLELPRHYGDPAAEYQAAVEGVGVRDRSHRTRLLITGRQPGEMLSGVVSGRIPGALEEIESGVASGIAEPQAVLTAKGRMVTDLRLWSAGLDTGDLFAEVPAAGAAPVREHLARLLPPRLARLEDVSSSTAMLAVLGPQAPALLSRLALGLRVDAEVLEAMSEGELRRLDVGDGSGVWVLRSADVAVPAWDLIADSDAVRTLWSLFRAEGAAAVGSGVWEALRLEAGRPAFGSDMDQSTLLPETGLEDRVVDVAKGCYTGQEVVVRIRDRGHVNRRLRRLRLADLPTPARDTELFSSSGEGPVGVVTSAAVSPRLGTLALAYLRREVEVPGEVRVGAADGPVAVVEG